MNDTIALICADCGTVVLRHPAMRLRRVVCYECVKARRRAARLAKRTTPEPGVGVPERLVGRPTRGSR